ncbi:MAG: hypothetical protein GY943_05420 [Chloroflexi bacterium]|nr:hypothetical protein [Chloroflexota bacterium]
MSGMLNREAFTMLMQHMCHVFLKETAVLFTTTSALHLIKIGALQINVLLTPCNG